MELFPYPLSNAIGYEFVGKSVRNRGQGLKGRWGCSGRFGVRWGRKR